MVVLVRPSAVMSMLLSAALLLSLKLFQAVLHGSTDYSRRESVAGVDAFRVFCCWQRRGREGGLVPGCAASVDVRDTDSARVRTIAWRRLNSSCTQLRHFWPWTRMLPFVQYRCMTSCFRSLRCSLAFVWHSSAGMADTHGHPLSCSLTMSLCCHGQRECHQCLPRSASCVSPRHPVREDTRPRPTVISGPYILPITNTWQHFTRYSLQPAGSAGRGYAWWSAARVQKSIT